MVVVAHLPSRSLEPIALPRIQVARTSSCSTSSSPPEALPTASRSSGCSSSSLLVSFSSSSSSRCTSAKRGIPSQMGGPCWGPPPNNRRPELDVLPQAGGLPRSQLLNSLVAGWVGLGRQVRYNHGLGCASCQEVQELCTVLAGPGARTLECNAHWQSQYLQRAMLNKTWGGRGLFGRSTRTTPCHAAAELALFTQLHCCDELALALEW